MTKRVLTYACIASDGASCALKDAVDAWSRLGTQMIWDSDYTYEGVYSVDLNIQFSAFTEVKVPNTTSTRFIILADLVSDAFVDWISGTLYTSDSVRDFLAERRGRFLWMEWNSRNVVAHLRQPIREETLRTRTSKISPEEV